MHLFPPLARRQPGLLLEKTVNLRMRGKATFVGDGVVAVVGAVLHHAHGCVEADAAQPRAEVGVSRLVEVFRQTPDFPSHLQAA